MFYELNLKTDFSFSNFGPHKLIVLPSFFWDEFLFLRNIFSSQKLEQNEVLKCWSFVVKVNFNIEDVWNTSIDCFPVGSIPSVLAWRCAGGFFQTVLKNVVEEILVSMDAGDTTVAMLWYDGIGLDHTSWAGIAAFWVS